MSKADKPEGQTIKINQGKNRGKIKNQISKGTYHKNGKNAVGKQFDFRTQKINYFQNQKNRYRGNLKFYMIKQKRIHSLKYFTTRISLTLAKYYYITYTYFMNFRHLLFDMDNTLYPASSAMDKGITRRMLECVADFFHCDMEKATELRAERIVHYSTTLEWLRAEGMSDVEGFLAHVHPDNEADELTEQPALRDFLLSLNMPMSILTNAPHEHADRVLGKLGVADLFEVVTDIRDAGFNGKPYPDAYMAALRKVGATIEDTLFLDDMQKYTDGWVAMGGTAILIGSPNGKPLAEDAKSMIAAKAANKSGKPGQTIRMASIYELPDFLKKE